MELADKVLGAFTITTVISIIVGMSSRVVYGCEQH